MIFSTEVARTATVPGCGLGVRATTLDDIRRRHAVQRLLLTPVRGDPGDQRGIAPLEYALLAGLVGIAVLGASFRFSTAEASLFGGIKQAVGQVAATLTSGTAGTGTGGASTTGSTGGTGSDDDGGDR